MGNVNEGHERDEGLSSASDSADDLSESPSLLSSDGRDNCSCSGGDPSDETLDPSVLSDTPNANSSLQLDAILAESTRIEQIIELNSYEPPEIGMASLTSNSSLPISESIIPSSFDIFGEAGLSAEEQEVFHTPDIFPESNAETEITPEKQVRIHPGFPEQSHSERHMPAAFVIVDNIESLPLDENGFKGPQLSILSDAADEIIAKFGHADLVATSTTIPHPSMGVKSTECDKCGHILSDGEKRKSPQNQTAQRPIEEDGGEKTVKEAVFLPEEEVVVNSFVDLLTNDITLEEVGNIDKATTGERSPELHVSLCDAQGEIGDYVSEGHIPPAAPSSDTIAKSEESSRGVDSHGSESRPQSPLLLANLASCERKTDDQEFDGPCQDFDIQAIVEIKDPKLPPCSATPSGVNANMQDLTAILPSPVSRAACSIIVVEPNAVKEIQVISEKSFSNQRKKHNVEETTLRDVSSGSSGAVQATLTENLMVNESTAKTTSCIPVKKDEKHVKPPQPARHTPDRPNWAIAPAEPAPKAPTKTQRRKPASRRGRKSGEANSKPAPSTPSTASAARNPVTPSTVTHKSSPKSSDIKFPHAKPTGTKTPKSHSPEIKAPTAKPVDPEPVDAKKIPKPILRLPDIGSYERPEARHTQVKSAVSFEATPLHTLKATTEGQSVPIGQGMPPSKAEFGASSTNEVVTALQPVDKTAALSRSMSSVEPVPPRRGRSMSISSAQISALPPNKRPASIVSSWRSGMALPVIPEGTTKFRQSEDGRKSLPATQSSVATVDVSAKDKIAAILAENHQSNTFKFEAPRAQGNNGATTSTPLHPVATTIPKEDLTFKQGKMHILENPQAEGFQTNEHSVLAWRHGVAQPSPAVVTHSPSGANTAVRKAEDKAPKNDVAASNLKGKKAVKATSKAKTLQSLKGQGHVTANNGHDDLSLHVQECGEPVRVNLPQSTISQDPLRYHTPPRTARPAFFSDVNAANPITPSPVSVPVHQHKIASQRLGAEFSTHSPMMEHTANADAHPQTFMPHRSEGISAQYSVRVEHPPQLRHYEFIPRNHTAPIQAGHPSSSVPTQVIDAPTRHLGRHAVQAPHASQPALTTHPSLPRQADNQFLSGMNGFNERPHPQDFSLYQQQLYQHRQAETTKQFQGLRHRSSESSFSRYAVNVGEIIPESWNSGLGRRPAVHQDNDVPIYQTARPSAPPTNFAARTHAPPALPGLRTNANCNKQANPINQFPPYN